jgi:hypothetical protein
MEELQYHRQEREEYDSKIDELLNPARAITGDGHINRPILQRK